MLPVWNEVWGVNKIVQTQNINCKRETKIGIHRPCFTSAWGTPRLLGSAVSDKISKKKQKIQTNSTEKQQRDEFKEND